MKKMNNQTQMEVNREYISTDFYLTAFLLVSGLELLEIRKITSYKSLFILKDTPQREKLIQDFFAGRASVNALAYKDKIQNLKSMLHNSHNGKEDYANGKRRNIPET